MYNNYPGNYQFPFHYNPTPQPTWEEVEKKQLRSDGNFVGVTLLLLIVAMQFLFTALVLALVALDVLPPANIYMDYLGLDNTTYLIIYAGIYTLNMVVPAILAAAFCGRLVNPFTPVKPVSGGILMLGILGGAGVCMFANIVTTYIQTFLENLGVPMPEFPKLLENTPTSLALNLLVIGVLPAIFEEMVFRGFILKSLRKYGDGFALFVAAVVFGLLHGNIVQVPFAFIVGIVLGWLYVVTNNIWMPILVHFLNNSLSVCMDYLTLDMTVSDANRFYAMCIYGLAFVGGVAFLSLVIFYRRDLKLKRYEGALTLGQRFGTLNSVPTYAIAVLIFLFLLVKEMI